MIRIQQIHIERFRGIRDLTLDLKGDTFGICGPNGTGKSGIVDGIEFALTGDVSRLSGPGRGDLSVKAHAPHVKERADPKQAKVTLTVDIPSIGKTARITRTVAQPSTYSVDPDTPQIREVFEELRIHPEFALSRREIIQYILAEPGKRSTDVQELLRLSAVEQTRRALTTIANDARRERDLAEQEATRERQEFLQCLGIAKADPNLVLAIVNAQRAMLALPPFQKLEVATSFKEGVPAVATPATARLQKAAAKTDLASIIDPAKQSTFEETRTKRTNALEQLRNLSTDAAALRVLRQQTITRLGVELIDEDKCPLCDKDWNRAALLDHLTKKLDSAAQAGQVLSTLSANLNLIIGEMEAFSGLLTRTITTGNQLESKPSTDAIARQKRDIESSVKAIRNFVATTSEIDAAIAALEPEWWTLSHEARTNVDACAAGIDKLPDVSPEDKARDFLTLAEERYRKAVKARSTLKEADDRHKMAAMALQTYEKQRDACLQGLYEEVAKDFTAYYRSLNQEDEGEFEGKLVPSAAKLGFDVDFYGYGKFPPGAYHSEGHQDGMGLCLYLALMKRTLGDKFTFSVLDDVLMSIDSDHRRSVCRLLRREFPNTQFILTTHDRVWLKFMHTEGLIKDSQTFSAWTVETGPRVWQHRDVWDEINGALEKGDVEAAAGLLRHFLEYMATILADAFRAEVRFKGDGQYTLEDLMPPALNRWRSKMSDAIKAAKSWDKEADVTRLTALLERIDDAYKRTQAEKWALNPTVHYNAWQNFQASEFRAVVQAFSDMLATMRCAACKTYVEFQPRHTSADTIRCTCGDLFINLKKKGAE